MDPRISGSRILLTLGIWVTWQNACWKGISDKPERLRIVVPIILSIYDTFCCTVYMYIHTFGLTRVLVYPGFAGSSVSSSTRGQIMTCPETYWLECGKVS